jgi:lysozyme family protein
MTPSVDTILADILRREGGFVDHSADRGGPTNKGITLDTLSRWRRHPAGIADLRALTDDEARAIYRAEYIDRPGLGRIRDPYLLALAVDCAVNHGPVRVIRWLQKIVGVLDDGVFGDVTEVAVNSADPVKLYQRLLGRRIEFYGEICVRDPSQLAFLVGWLRRACEFLEAA